MKIKVKELKNKKIILSLILFCFFISFSFVYGATTTNPTLVTKLNSAMKKIITYLETLATPIASIALIVGILMRKLSFGDEEKLAKGKKVIINAIVGYALVLSLDWIISFLQTILK